MSLSVVLRHRFPASPSTSRSSVPSPGVTVLFGPSGAGKSTVIDAAAGLLRPDDAASRSATTLLADTRAGIWLPPERRRVGLVFQDSRGCFRTCRSTSNLMFGMRRAAGRRDRF